MNRELHIIYLMTFSPKFGYIKGNNSLDRAAHIWQNSKDEQIGVWHEDWAFQLGNKIIDKYDNYTWEVWRPDIRADKVYSHIFDNGLLTKSFPVKKIKIWSGIKKSEFIYSPDMLLYLEEYINNKPKNIEYLVVLPASRNGFALKIREKFKGKIAMHYNHFLYARMLLGEWRFNINPIRFLHDNVKLWQQEQFLKSIKSLMVAHKEFIAEINKKFSCEVNFNTMGANLDYWNPDVSSVNAKKELAIEDNGHIFLFSSRLVPEYQIHKILKVIGELKDKKFHCFFTSQGPEKYGQLLKNLINKYNIEDKVTFSGYVDEDKLKLLYSAADTFFMTSLINAGPMSTFYAMLMECQVITTDAGLAAEILKENDCGIIVPATNYKKWKQAMEYAINGNKIKKIDSAIINNLFNWENRSEKWNQIFTNAIKIHQPL